MMKYKLGIIEVQEPAGVVCAWHQEWSDLPVQDQASLKARQGVVYTAQEALMVADSDTMDPVACSGELQYCA